MRARAVGSVAIRYRERGIGNRLQRLAAVAVTAALAGHASIGALAAETQRAGNSQSAQADTAQQDAARHSFDIPAQPLASALTLFGRQSGLQIAADSEGIAGLRTQGLQGNFTAGEALRRLLAGSGLRYRFTSAGAVTLEPAVAGPENRPGDETESGPLLLGEITVEGRLKVDPADTPFTTPGSSAYISREQIDRVQPSSPGDIFREVPGVLSGASNDGTSINVNIRSSQGLNRVRTMVEGTQQESSNYQGYIGADQRTYIDPELIGGVEISKGPGGGPYGTGTTSGVVNIGLLEADDLVQEGRNIGLRLRGGLGGNAVDPRFLPFEDCCQRHGTDTGLIDDRDGIFTKDNWFGSLAGAYRDDHFEVVAAYSRRKEGNYFAGSNTDPEEIVLTQIEEGQEVPNTSEDTESFLIKGALRFGDGQSIEAGFTRYESEFGQVFPSSILLWAPQQWALNEVDSKRFWLRHKWESENDLLNLQTNVWVTTAHELGEARQAPQENDAWGAEVWNASFLQTPLGDLSLTYGAEYSMSEALVDSPTFRQGIAYVPGERAVWVNEPVSPAFDGKRQVYGGYLNAVLEPTDWLALNAGLRYDGFDAESVSNGYVCDPDFSEVNELDARQRALNERRRNTPPGPERDSITVEWRAALQELREALNRLDGFCGYDQIETKMHDRRLSPRFGVTVEPLQGLQLFAQYAEGFRAPSLVELGQTVNGPVTVNPDLEPEVVKTWEVGLNVLRDGLLFSDDAFRAKLVYFNNNYDSYVTRTGRVDDSGPLDPFFYENVSDVTISGYEASLYYDVGWVFADLNFSVFDEPFSLPTQAAIDQPEYSGSATLGTRWFDESLVLGGRVTFFGEPSLELASPNTTFTTFYWEAQEIFDLFGSYEVNDHISLGFSVENVADTFYVAPLYGSNIPGPGRTFRVNFTARF